MYSPFRNFFLTAVSASCLTILGNSSDNNISAQETIPVERVERGNYTWTFLTEDSSVAQMGPEQAVDYLRDYARTSDFEGRFFYVERPGLFLEGLLFNLGGETTTSSVTINSEMIYHITNVFLFSDYWDAHNHPFPSAELEVEDLRQTLVEAQGAFSVTQSSLNGINTLREQILSSELSPEEKSSRIFRLEDLSTDVYADNAEAEVLIDIVLSEIDFYSRDGCYLRALHHALPSITDLRSCLSYIALGDILQNDNVVECMVFGPGGYSILSIASDSDVLEFPELLVKYGQFRKDFLDNVPELPVPTLEEALDYFNGHVADFSRMTERVVTIDYVPY